jgi:hypothetical protein
MNEEAKELQTIKCGIIMPIAQIDGLMPDHWLEIKDIFVEAASSIPNYEFITTIVSEAEDSGIIQKRIIQNLYSSDIVICDVSAKNPNVMFELGMRLAFDKATIIVKDNQTDYSFDTGVIEHLEYPRDLRFSKIVEFKKNLSKKLVATLEASKTNTEYSTFLKSFGEFNVVKLNEKEVTPDTAILESIQDLTREVNQLRKNTRRKTNVLHEFPQEAIIKARQVIQRYFNELGVTKIEDVANTVNLYTEIMDAINAKRFFPEESEFKNFYNYILSQYCRVDLT